MSRGTGGVPNAWDDDDWVSQTASKAAAQVPQPPLNKQERMQQHVETNRKLWESADSPETFHYIEANTGGVPLGASSYKPQVKVLSRKPILAKKKDPATGMSMLSLDDDEEEEAKLQGGGAQLTPEEIRAKQRREREERQKRYDEARAKIFGESAPSSRVSSPGTGTGNGTGTVTPPRSDGRSASARGRGRGGNYRNMNGNNANNNTNYNNSGGSNSGNNSNNSAVNYSFDNRRSINSMAATRELYDPNSSPRPDSLSRGRGGSSSGGENSPRVQTPREDTQQVQHPAIRSPRGPDSSGRGGFAFARRGARET